jgi:SAM-dependent methyltransferase
MYFASYYRWLVIRDWIRLHPSDRLLDVGCDDGEITARLPTAERVAIDLNPRCPDPTVPLIQSDAQRLPFASSSFDAVCAFDVIEHIPDDRAVLFELVRVLKEGGNLWLSTPSVNFKLFPAFVTARANRGWGHVRNGYSVSELKRKLPERITLDVLPWNAPFFRLTHVGLRLLDELSTSLTRRLAGLCFRLDRRWPAGGSGHLFVRVSKSR